MTEAAKNVAVAWLGVASLASLGFMVLALLDIGQGSEPDLSLEWAVVRAALVLALVFHVAALRRLWTNRRRV